MSLFADDFPALKSALCFLLSAVAAGTAEDFEASRIRTVTGSVLDGETDVRLDLKAASMRDGAKCVYDVKAANGRFAQKVKLFPGFTVPTAETATGVDQKLIRFSVEKPALQVQLGWAGNNQDYDLHVNEVYFNNKNSGGGVLDHDWTENSSEGNPIENVTYAAAEAGLYRIYVYYYADNERNEDGEEVGSPQTTTVRVYVNGNQIYSGSYLITEHNGNGTGDGKSIWNVGTVVLHSGDSAGGYAVDGYRLDLAGQGELKGVSPRTTFSVEDIAGPNDKDPVYLCVGDAAQFTASGTLNSGSGNEQTDTEIIERFTSTDDTVGTVDALGVFVAKAPGHTQISCEGYSGNSVDVYVYKVEIEEMNFIDSIDAAGTEEDNNFDIANDDGTSLLIPAGEAEWTAAAGTVGETVYTRNRKVRADVKLKVSPVISGHPLELKLFSTGDLDFTPSGTAEHSLTLTFDTAGYATHSFTTYNKKTVDWLERKKYTINWQGSAGTKVEQCIYTLHGKPVDHGPGTVSADCPRYVHLKYLLGPEVFGKGNWCHQKSTMKERTTDSIIYALYGGIVCNGTFIKHDGALADVWDVVKGSGGLCLEYAKLMKEALLVAGVPDLPRETNIKVRNVVSEIVRPTWLGGMGKTVLQSFYEFETPGPGQDKWYNQGVCGVRTSDQGWRYYDLTGPGRREGWATGSGGWATPDQPDTPGPKNLWYQNLPSSPGPVIMRFTGSECYGTWFSDAVSSEEGDFFEQFDTFRSQIKITHVDPWVGDTITVHYRTEGVLNNGEKVEVTLYNKQGDVEVDHKELAVVSKWNNFQQITFTVPNNSGEKFYFYARILTSNGEGFNAWIDPASVDTTKP